MVQHLFNLFVAVALFWLLMLLIAQRTRFGEIRRKLDSLTQRHEHLVESLDVQHQVNREQLRLINELAYDAARKGGG